jgi:histidinol phosphatase-like PHP family hydrolase
MGNTSRTAGANVQDAPATPADLNVEVAGMLLEMSALQASRQSGLGYRRAAHAIFSLETPVTEFAERGTLRDIPGIGPSSERIIAEYLGTGHSIIVEGALERAPTSKQEDVTQRRAMRAGFLSLSSVLAALRARMPAGIVSPDAYRGDYQMHTTWSDGDADLETMATACQARGRTRMCVTDHSYGLPIARGMSMEHARQQHVEIDALNERFEGRFRILKGIEANILADGVVDMTPGELGRFELVIAAPHSLLRKPYDQTSRMLGAVRTPGVHVLGHPRGRMFNNRAGVRAHWDRVFEAAAVRGVAIELDGTWDRQDVDASLAARALTAGCVFAIDSDAHSPFELQYVDYAMAHARLARIPAEKVINCWEDERLLEWARARRVKG